MGEKLQTTTLGNLAEIYLGKVILKEDIVPDGNARVVSISNVSDKGLDYEAMDHTNVSEEDMEKYAIQNHDVLITCRGTKFRTVLVENKPNQRVIASGNLMVLRCEHALDAAVIHLYLQSPMGEEAIQHLNPGKSVINLGKKQLQTLDIPVLSRENKEKLVTTWQQGRKKYENTILQAEDEWHHVKGQVVSAFRNTTSFELPSIERKKPDLSMKENEATLSLDQQIPKKENQSKRRDRLLIELD